MPIPATRRLFLRLAAGLLAAQPLSAVAQARSAGPVDASARTAASAGSTEQVGRGAVLLPTARQTPATEAIRQPAAGEPAFEKLLRMLPDGDRHLREVYLNDYALAARQAGVQPPLLDADDDAVKQYILRLGEMGITSGGLLSGIDEYFVEGIARRKYLAVGIGNVTHAARIANAPQDIELVLGTLDPDATEAALTVCTECAPATRETHLNVPYYTWGEDFGQSLQDRFKPPAYDALGRGGRIAVQPGFGYRTVWTEGMHWAIEASQGTRSTLADVTPYPVMANALAGLGAYTVFLTNDVATQAGSAETIVRNTGTRLEGPSATALDPALLLRPYVALALGAGTDEAGPFMTIGLIHPRPELAAENAVRLPERIKQTASIRANRPWSELWGDVEARAEGNYLFARVRRVSNNALVWLAWFYQRDSLLYWG